MEKNIKKFDYSKKIIDLAMLYTVRDSIRSGDLFVKESKKYNSIDFYLVLSQQTNFINESTNLLDNLKEMIIIPKKINFLTDITQDEKSNFSKRIYAYFPKITMSEILYEVNSWTDIFEELGDFSNASSEKEKNLVAALLSNGHNLGFSKMSIASGVSKSALARADELYLTYENLLKHKKI